jgi:hypothetical protein
MTDNNSLRPPFLTTPQAASFLSEQNGFPIAAHTLRKMRVVGGGPVFRRFGRLVVYDPRDLLQWASQRLSVPLVSTSACSTGEFS